MVPCPARFGGRRDLDVSDRGVSVHHVLLESCGCASDGTIRRRGRGRAMVAHPTYPHRVHYTTSGLRCWHHCLQRLLHRDHLGRERRLDSGTFLDVVVLHTRRHGRRYVQCPQTASGSGVITSGSVQQIQVVACVLRLPVVSHKDLYV